MLTPSSLKQNTLRTFIAFLIATFPIAFSIWSYKAYSHSEISNVIPVLSDEIDYWLQCRSFEKVNFDSGYFTLDETTPTLTFSPYGWHGPAFPILVGTLAKLWGGVPLSAAMAFNLAWLTASLVVFMLLVKPGLRHLWLLFFFVIGLARLYWYMPSFFQEPYHCGLGFVLAGLFLRLLGAKRKLAWFWVTFVVLFGASYLRVSWAVFFFPLMLSVFPATAKGRISALASGLASLAAVYMLYQYSTAPFSLGEGRNYALDFLTGKSSVLKTAQLFFTLAIVQVSEYLSSYNAVDDPEMLLIVLWFVAGIFILFRDRLDDSTNSQQKYKINDVFLVHFFGIGGLFFLEIVYFGFESRVIIPHFIVSFVLISSLSARSFLPKAFIIIQIAIFPMFFQFFPDRIYPLANNTTERRLLVDFERFIKPMVSYKPNSNRWCNTVLLGQLEWPGEIMAFDPGIGTSFIALKQNELLKKDVKSRYLFLTNDAQVSLVQMSSDFRFLAHTAMGDLYLNNKCQCD